MQRSIDAKVDAFKGPLKTGRVILGAFGCRKVPKVRQALEFFEGSGTGLLISLRRAAHERETLQADADSYFSAKSRFDEWERAG